MNEENIELDDSSTQFTADNLQRDLDVYNSGWHDLSKDINHMFN